MKIATITLLFSLNAWAQACDPSKEIEFHRIRRNKQLLGFEILTIFAINEMYCLYECSQSLECGSVDYHERDEVCKLNYPALEGSSLVDDFGWKHMEITTPKKTPFTTMFIYWKEERRPEQSYLQHIIPIQKETWKITFDMVLLPNSKSDGNVYYSVFHFSVNENASFYVNGNRTPSLFLKGTTLHFAFSKDGNPNVYFNTNIDMAVKYAIMIKQKYSQRYNQHKIVIRMDGNKVYDQINTQPMIFENVKFYFSDPWYPAAPVAISNFEYRPYA